MANKKISELDAVTNVLSTDEYVLARSATTKKITGADLTSAFGGGGTELDYAEFTSNVTISATSGATANTLVTGASISYDGSTVVLIEFFCIQAQTGTNGVLLVELYDGSTDLGSAAVVQDSAGVTSTPVYAARRLTPSAAAHTYSWRAWRSVANGTFVAGTGTGVMPGFLRITIV